MALISERGIHALSLREAARRAGVSSGAPYRHFADKDALLVAIAEDAEALLAEHTTAEITRCESSDPIEEFRAHGIAFVTFAATHPVHFRLLCSPDILALREAESNTLSEDTPSAGGDDEAKLQSLVTEANVEGDVEALTLAGRSLAYGLARLIVDGQLPGIELDHESVRALAIRVLGVLGSGISPAATQ